MSVLGKPTFTTKPPLSSSATKKKAPLSQAEQSAAFIKAARELGCDESEERFNDAPKAVAKHKPRAEPGRAKKPAR